MFNIHLLTIGKLSEPYAKLAEEKYIKQLKSYAKIHITELPEESFRSIGEKEAVQKKEAEKILPFIEKAGEVILLHERGKPFTSEEFSEFLTMRSARGQEILFVIGGPLGFHNSVLDLPHTKLSLSAFTFPHQLTRIILLEQLYRAGTIAAGKQYHY